MPAIAATNRCCDIGDTANSQLQNINLFSKRLTVCILPFSLIFHKKVPLHFRVLQNNFNKFQQIIHNCDFEFSTNSQLTWCMWMLYAARSKYQKCEQSDTDPAWDRSDQPLLLYQRYCKFATPNVPSLHKTFCVLIPTSPNFFARRCPCASMSWKFPRQRARIRNLFCVTQNIFKGMTALRGLSMHQSPQSREVGKMKTEFTNKSCSPTSINTEI